MPRPGSCARVSSRSVPIRSTSTRCQTYIDADHRRPTDRIGSATRSTAAAASSGPRATRSMALRRGEDQSKPHSAQTGSSGCHRTAKRYPADRRSGTPRYAEPTGRALHGTWVSFSDVARRGVWDGAGMEDYRIVNRANWDERAPAHAASPDYQVERFVEDPGFLSQVVRFDLPRLWRRPGGWPGG